MPLFRLIPFAPDPRVAELTLTGSVELSGPTLCAEYLLSGPLSQLAIPELAAKSVRRDDLWRNTCFELFAGARDQPRYLEVNLSPSGDWNAYAFTSYREGMAPLAVARFESHCRRRSASELEIRFTLDLDTAESLGSIADLAVTAILEQSDGAKSYWALSHTSDRPDFHSATASFCASNYPQGWACVGANIRSCRHQGNFSYLFPWCSIFTAVRRWFCLRLLRKKRRQL